MTAAVVVRGMQPCPHCGVLLEGSLVAAIRDPRREESCPKRPAPKTFAMKTTHGGARPVMDQRTVGRIRDLAALMMLGAQLRESAVTAPEWVLDGFVKEPYYPKILTPMADRVRAERDEQIRSLEERLGIEEEAA